MWTDCRGNEHSTEIERLTADVEIVEEILNEVVVSQTEYCTENTDFPDGCGHIVHEVSHTWGARFEEWAEVAEFEDKPSKEEIVQILCDGIDGYDEAEFSHNEYAAYDGYGVCLYSLDLGEQEEQIEISSYPELQDLHDQGRLDSVLDSVTCDLYISRSRQRVNQGTTDKPHYVEVGDPMYNPHGHDHPCLMGYYNPGGQWHYLVEESTLHDTLCAGLEDQR